ncbi:mCG146118, partial [Mus musculus]
IHAINTVLASDLPISSKEEWTSVTVGWASSSTCLAEAEVYFCDQDSSKAQQNPLQHGGGLKTVRPSERPCRQVHGLLSVGRTICPANTLPSEFIPSLPRTQNWRLEGKPPVDLVSAQGDKTKAERLGKG